MPRKKYLIVKEIISIDDVFLFNGKIENLILSLEELADKYGKDAYVELDAGYNNISAYLTIKRKETDEEREKRLKIESEKKKRIQERKKKDKEKRHELYEELKKEFENDRSKV